MPFLVVHRFSLLLSSLDKTTTFDTDTRQLVHEHNKKLKALREKQKVTYTTNQKLHPQTHNNTNVHFSHNEIDLLNKVLKHNLKSNTNNKNQIINEILDLETAIQKTESKTDSQRIHTPSHKTHNR
jgi:hypothetical protein